MIVLFCLLLASVPAAQAYVPAAPPVAATCSEMNASPVSHGCCGQACDCAIEQPGKGMIPSLVPAPLRAADPSVTLALTVSPDPVPAYREEAQSPRADRSPPPQDPLYQTYSEYRL